MTALQKTFVTAFFAVVLGTAIYEEQRASRLHSQLVEMEQQQAPTAKRIAQLQNDLTLALHRLAESSPQPITADAVLGSSKAAQNSGDISTDRIIQLLNATTWPSLTADQADRYLTRSC